MNQTAVRTDVAQPFRSFEVQVDRVSRLSPSFVRVTFTGDDLDRFADNGFDQRIKFFLPVPDGGASALSFGPDWYTQWRALPTSRRPPMRTYTVRAVRPAEREIDVDVVLHGDGGPASRWATAARPGDRITILGPNADYRGHHGGVDFVPARRTARLLLAGDETAVPAICSILERLPATAVGEALLEVPEPADALELTKPPGVVVRWLARAGAEHGALLVPAVRATAAAMLRDGDGDGGGDGGGRRADPARTPLEDVDVDTALLWEVPVDPAGRPLAAQLDLYAWLAGEAGVIKVLRRHLVADLGIDRSAVAFMGYWRRGRAEVS